MNEIITTAAIKADVAIQELKANLAKRNERGADILEYVGMILLAAVLVAGLFAAASGLDLAGKFTTAANEILGPGA